MYVAGVGTTIQRQEKVRTTVDSGTGDFSGNKLCTEVRTQLRTEGRRYLLNCSTRTGRKCPSRTERRINMIIRERFSWKSEEEQSNVFIYELLK